MSIPYLVGRRTSDRDLAESRALAKSNLRAENSGRMVLAPVGWSIATFGAGAVLGWTSRRLFLRKPGKNDAS